MATGITLLLREIKAEPTVTRPDIYKKMHCWPDMSCVSGVSDRGTRRNRMFKRGRFADIRKGS
jgi:hypothetical protein